MTIIAILDSIEAYKVHGTGRHMLEEAMREEFNITPAFKSLLSHYQLLYWSPLYFLDTSEHGTITRGGITYNIVYGGGFTRGKILRLSKENTRIQLALSFRAALPIFNLPGYVMVAV